MTITVIDNAAATRRALRAPEAERAVLVRELWEPLAGLYDFVPGGVDLAEVHAQNFGFPLRTSVETADLLEEGLDALVAAEAWSRTRVALQEAVRVLTAADPDLVVPDLRVLLVLGDPTDPLFRDEFQGLSAFGGISGFITVTLWPHPRVLERVEAIAVHELHHNLRYSPGGVVWDPAVVTVGEQVIAEGLAEVFATELHGDRGPTHFVDERAWEDDVLATVATGLGVAGMADFASWVLGDSSARRFGADPVGLPTGAGYAAGTRLVRAYLDATASSAAHALRTPARDILDLALPRLGL